MSIPLPLHLKEMPRGERPRERLKTLGAHALSSAELLAILIGTGTARRSALALAHDALARADGSLRRLAAQPVAALTAVAGLGTAPCHGIEEVGRGVRDQGRREDRRIRRSWSGQPARTLSIHPY